MNKKILFYYSQLNIGGAEKSLIRLMNALSNDGNEVTLLTRYSYGKAEQFLDESINIMALADPRSGITRKITTVVQRIKNTIKIKQSKQKYDLAIIGLHGLSPAILPKILTADKFVQCIRSDLSMVAAKERIVKTLKQNSNMINSYLCVSKTAMQSLVEAIPDFRDKAFVLYNLLDVENMCAMANEAKNPFSDDSAFKIVSVCRISDRSKGVFRMLDCLEVLVCEGYNVKWFLVGDGPDLKSLNEEIKKRNLKDRFITVGSQNNPFGFYKYANLVVVPSYYEGLCGVVNEAKITGCAVLATKFSGIHEQLIHGENGWIVENNTDAIIEGLRRLIDDKELLLHITNDTYPEAIKNDNEKLSVFYKILGWS